MKRTLRVTAWIVGSVLLLIVLLVAAVLTVGNTASGRHLIERQAAALTEGRVRFSGLSGSFPSAIDIAQLRLSDERGVWLSAERASLRWSPLALLARHIDVALIRVDNLYIERRPVTEPTPQKSERTNLPRIDIHRLQIGTLTLGPALAGTRASLVVQGHAHLVSIQDATASLVARRTDGKGRYEVWLAFDPARMDASVKLEESAGGTLANLLQYPDLGAVSVHATLKGPRHAEQLQLRARAGELDAGVNGTLDLARESADLTYRVEAPAMTLRPGFSWQRVSLQGQWRGTVRSPQAAGRLRILELKVPGGAELADLAAELNADRGALGVRATAGGVVLPGPQPKLLSESPLRLHAQMRLNEPARPLQLTAEHRLFSLRAGAKTAGARSARFDLRLPDVTPLARLAGQDIRGQARLEGTVAQSPTTTHLNLDIHSDLAADASSLLSRMAEGTSRLQLAANLTDRTVNLQRLSLVGRALSFSASGSADRDSTGTAGPVRSVRARYKVDLPHVSVLSPALDGTLSIGGDIEGPVKDMVAQLEANSNLSIRGGQREALHARIEARGLPSLASATLQVQGDLAAAPLRMNAAVDRTGDGRFHIVVQRTEWKSARVEGDLVAAADMNSGKGTLQLRMDRLADLEPLLGTKLSGRLGSRVTLTPVDGKTHARLQLDAENVATPALSANAHLVASGPTDALDLQISLSSPDLGGKPASLDAAARLNVDASRLDLRRANASYQGQSIRLLSPARLVFEPGLAIHQLKLGAQKAVITVDGRVSPALDLRASVRQVDAGLVNAFVPGLLAEGSIDADARLQGDATAPVGVVTFKAGNLRLATAAARDLSALNVQATAHLTGTAAQLEGRLDAGDGSRLTLNGGLPLDANGPLSLRLAGKIDASLVNPMLAASGKRAGGTLAVNATVNGTPRAPDLEGTVDLTDGQVRDYVQGLQLTGITAHLVARQGSLQIAKLTARAGPGQITAAGTIGVLQPQIPIDLQLTAHDAQPITSDVLTAKLNADLAVKGTLRERIDLTGTVDLKRAVVGIPDEMPPDVAVLDVRRPGEAPPAPRARALVIGLDLALRAPRAILIQGRGLDAEVGGDLRITGTTAAPRIDGGFDMIRGSFKLVSTTLKFTKGRVSFNGAGLSRKIVPTLDFTAEAEVSDGTATLHITGLADAPQFELSSTPQLPQDEILARLLFGESASELTALQIAEIGSALATLSGVGGSGGHNPVAKVQKALGLDRLSVGAGGGKGESGGQGSGGTTVEAGRYVSSRVYVGARQSSNGGSKLEVDFDVSKRLKVQTQLASGSPSTQGATPENDPGDSIGLMYQFEY